MITHIPREDSMTRVETGVVQFGNDWPGVFIRGDNGAGYALALESVKPENPIVAMQLKELAALFHAALTTTA